MNTTPIPAALQALVDRLVLVCVASAAETLCDVSASRAWLTDVPARLRVQIRGRYLSGDEVREVRITPELFEVVLADLFASCAELADDLIQESIEQEMAAHPRSRSHREQIETGGRCRACDGA